MVKKDCFKKHNEMTNPLVSVIIPTYDRTHFLKLTIDSILNQTFQDFEIIVVDDGTPNENNLVICSKYDNVKYIKIKNSGGPAKPRNVGIKESQGKYLAFVDDDDVWLPTKLEKQVKILEQNPDFGLVHSCCEVINEDGISQNIIVGRPGNPDVKHGDVKMRMMGNWTVMMPTPLIRKSVIDVFGGFNENIPGTFADVEYWTRASFYTKFYYLDLPLVHYRIHANNMSSDKLTDIQLPNCLKVLLKMFLNEYIIDKVEYKYLLNNLIRSQIKMFHLSFFKNIHFLFKLDRMWFLRFSNVKLMIFILFFKK